MKKYLVEALGTFFLVLTVCVAAVFGTAGALAPFAIGLVLAIMIYAGGHISGAHYNPAVTTAVFLRGKCAVADVPFYMAAQLVGAVVAVFAAKVLVPEVTVTTADFGAKVPAVLLAEFLFTFALAWAVLNTATAKGMEGNSYFGLSIGGTVLVGALTVGSISLGVFNPAVAVGLVVIGKLSVGMLAPFVVVQLVAGACAAFAFRFLASERL